MIDIVPILLLIVVGVGVVIFLMRWRLRMVLRTSLKRQEKRVGKLSNNQLQKQYLQTVKMESNNVLSKIMFLFYANDYENFLTDSKEIYQREMQRRGLS